MSLTQRVIRPIKQRNRPTNVVDKKTVRDEIQEMTENEIIQPSKSPWSSPIVLVKKKDGTTRFCVDYRKLNQVTKKDTYPLPRINEIIESIAKRRYYSTLDMASGYWQIRIKEADIEKTAFICSEGLFEFLVMPFGLCNAPATYQRMMDEVLRDLDWTVGEGYIDDIISGSDNFSDHMKRHEEVV